MNVEWGLTNRMTKKDRKECGSSDKDDNENKGNHEIMGICYRLSWIPVWVMGMFITKTIKSFGPIGHLDESMGIFLGPMTKVNDVLIGEVCR